MKASAIPTETKYRYAGSAAAMCRLATRSVVATKRTAVPNSTNGYLALIDTWHEAHFPRRKSQPRTGTLWRLWIVTPHDRHLEAGRTTDCAAGTR